MRDSAVAIALVRPDLLGTYGDGGNAVVLQQRLLRRGVPAEVVVVGSGDVVPENCEICVLGGGEDSAQALLSEQRELGTSLQRAAARGTAILAVCAAFQVLGRSYLTGDGVLRDGFGVIDCATNERLEQRAVGEIVAAGAVDGRDVGLLSGFENHGGATTLGPDAAPLGTVMAGVGNGEGVGGAEGAWQGTVVATYLHGPVLARNPRLADALLEIVVGPLPPLEVPGVQSLRTERLRIALDGDRKR